MKKIVLLFIISFPTFCEEDVQNILVNGNWTQMGLYDNDSFAYIMTFEENGDYKISLNSILGFAEIEGQYEVDGTVIRTYPTEDSFGFDQLLIDGLEWTLHINPQDSADFAYVLMSEYGFYLSDKNNVVPVGVDRYINSIEVITVEKLHLPLRVDSRVRKGPGTDYALEQFYSNGMDYSYLESGTHVITLARTLDLVSINGQNDYWYFVEIRLDPYSENGNINGWIYGGLLDFSSSVPFDRYLHSIPMEERGIPDFF